MDATFDPRPIPWNEFPAECLWYLVPMSVVHLVVFIVVCSLLAILSWRQANKMFRRIGRFGLFMILLLLVGALFNGFWSCTVYGRFYRSSDYVFGFIPFWPLTDIWVESRDAQGHLLEVPYCGVPQRFVGWEI